MWNKGLSTVYYIFRCCTTSENIVSRHGLQQKKSKQQIHDYNKGIHSLWRHNCFWPISAGQSKQILIVWGEPRKTNIINVFLYLCRFFLLSRIYVLKSSVICLGFFFVINTFEWNKLFILQESYISLFFTPTIACYTVITGPQSCWNFKEEIEGAYKTMY